MKWLRTWCLRLLPLALVAFLVACGAAVGVLSVDIAEETLRLAKGDSATLSVDVEVTGAASQDVAWSSSADAVATVDQSGVVTAVGAGTVSVIAESVADPSKSDRVTVQVIAPPAMGSAPLPGEVGATVGGTSTPVTRSSEDGALILSVGESELVVGFEDANGEGLPVLPGGVPRVTEDGAITIAGSGFLPGTAVDVWFFSMPTLLGSVRTDATGSFSVTYDLPGGTEIGGHSLVSEGLDPTGSKLSLRLGIEIQAGDKVQEFAHCPATSDWFVSAPNGSDDAAGTTVGDPLATIQAAVDAAVAGDAVCIAAGTYAVDNSGVGAGGADVVLVNVDKPLALYGPNVGISGTVERRPEAELVVSSSEADTMYAFAVDASDVVIDGFSVTTLTPKTDPFPDGLYGVWVGAGATQGVVVSNNRLLDTNFPIWVNRYRAGQATGFLIEHNFIEGPEAESDQGIMLQGAFGEIRDNVIRDARVGIQVQPYQLVGDGVVAGNDIEAFQSGLWFNYQENVNAHWSFVDNTVLGVPSPWGWPLYTTDKEMWTGIRIETFYGGTVEFDGNQIAVGMADPPGAAYLVRQKSVTDGEVEGIGTAEEVGTVFSNNTFPDFGAAGVTADDLSDDNGLIQLEAPSN